MAGVPSYFLWAPNPPQAQCPPRLCATAVSPMRQWLPAAERRGPSWMRTWAFLNRPTSRLTRFMRTLSLAWTRPLPQRAGECLSLKEMSDRNDYWLDFADKASFCCTGWLPPAPAPWPPTLAPPPWSCPASPAVWVRADRILAHSEDSGSLFCHRVSMLLLLNFTCFQVFDW